MGALGRAGWGAGAPVAAILRDGARVQTAQLSLCGEAHCGVRQVRQRGSDLYRERFGRRSSRAVDPMVNGRALTETSLVAAIHRRAETTLVLRHARGHLPRRDHPLAVTDPPGGLLPPLPLANALTGTLDFELAERGRGRACSSVSQTAHGRWQLPSGASVRRGLAAQPAAGRSAFSSACAANAPRLGRYRAQERQWRARGACRTCRRRASASSSRSCASRALNGGRTPAAGGTARGLGECSVF